MAGRSLSAVHWQCRSMVITDWYSSRKLFYEFQILKESKIAVFARLKRVEHSNFQIRAFAAPI